MNSPLDTRVRVLIAVDGSDDASQIVDGTFRLFGDQAEYFVVSVASSPYVASGFGAMEWGVGYPMTLPMAVSPRVSNSADPDADEPITASDIAEQQAAAAVELAELDDAEIVGEVGNDYATRILEVAEEFDVDVIAVGQHDRGWFSTLIAPSVSKDVVKKAAVPVLIVPRG